MRSPPQLWYITIFRKSEYLREFRQILLGAVDRD